jgi:BirA family biotin operon repressor/biotin-[acetyl-CoA-carboxylase] ligase
MIAMTIGIERIFLEELTSTNNHAIKLLSVEKPREGTIVRTGFQTAGRGQPGNSWESEKGKNLLFSIILYPEVISPGKQFIVSMALSLGIRDFLDRFVSGSSIKWPNDIYVKDDKIAGILIESSTMGEKIQYLVAGIGFNLNQEKFISDAPNPVSLKQLTGVEYDTEGCLDELSQCLDIRYEQLKNGDITNIKKDYIKHLFRYGKWSEFKAPEGTFRGTIKKVDEDGCLTILKRSGEETQFYFKEVEFVL